MFVIRPNLFETNSSSTSTFVYNVDLEIPKVVKINSDGNTMLDIYYNQAVKQNEKNNFIAYLKSLGVVDIFIDRIKFTDEVEFIKRPKIINEACLYCNVEDPLKYIMFGHWFYESDCSCEEYNKPNYVYMEWFV